MRLTQIFHMHVAMRSCRFRRKDFAESSTWSLLTTLCSLCSSPRGRLDACYITKAEHTADDERAFCSHAALSAFAFLLQRWVLRFGCLLSSSTHSSTQDRSKASSTMEEHGRIIDVDDGRPSGRLGLTEYERSSVDKPPFILTKTGAQASGYRWRWVLPRW